METKEWEELCEKVKLQYGTQAERIIRDRPGLSEEEIVNFDIFDEKIIEVLGFGGVNSFITYNMSSSGIISELSHNEELLKDYKEFIKMTGDFYPNTAIGLDDKLNSFYNHRNLIRQIIQSNKQEELKDNLLLMLRDQEYKSSLIVPKIEEIKGLKVQTIEQLSKYDITRNNIFHRLIEDNNITDYDLKELIIMKYFGNIQNTGGEYNRYNHEKFLRDYLKFNSSELEEAEVDLVELYSMVENCTSVEQLKRLNDFFASRNELSPVRMKYIDRKVAENYKQEYVDYLLKTDDVKKIVADPNNKSYLQTIFKKNGDVIDVCGIKKSDGTLVTEDFIRLKDGTELYEYDTNNPDYSIIRRIVKKDSTTIQFKYKGEDNEVVVDKNIVKKMRITMNKSANIPNSKRIEILVQPSSKENDDNAIYTYRVYSDDETRYYECQCNCKYGQEVGDWNVKRSYKVVDALSGKDIVKKSSPEIRKDENLNIFCLEAMKYVYNTEQTYLEYMNELKNGTPIKKFDKKKEMIIEEGDIPRYVLYDVDLRKLCISAQRGFTFVEPENKIAKNRMLRNVVSTGNGKYTGTIEHRVEIEKYLEGGLSTRSCYFGTLPLNFEIGIGMGNFDANSIIGFNSRRWYDFTYT